MLPKDQYEVVSRERTWDLIWSNRTISKDSHGTEKELSGIMAAINKKYRKLITDSRDPIF